MWTAGQTAQFLRHVCGHRLYALFHLVALRGMRRGEAAESLAIRHDAVLGPARAPGRRAGGREGQS